MNKNLDLRVQKTYSCLMNALLDLVKEKDFEAITVNELCEKALVGRGTFYKHFADKYEFYSFVQRELLNHYIMEADEQKDRNDPCSYYTAFFASFLRFIEKSNETFGPPTSSPMVSMMMYSTSDIISQKLEEHLLMDAEEGYPLSVQPISAARFLTGAMAQSALYLIRYPEEAQKEKIVADMKILIKTLYEPAG